MRVPFSSEEMITFLDWLEECVSPKSGDLNSVKTICSVSNFMNLTAFHISGDASVFDMARTLFVNQDGLSQIQYPTCRVGEDPENLTRINMSDWPGVLLALEHQADFVLKSKKRCSYLFTAGVLRDAQCGARCTDGSGYCASCSRKKSVQRILDSRRH